MQGEQPTTPEEWWPKSEWGGDIIGRTWALCAEVYQLGADIKVGLTRPEGGPRITIAFDHYIPEES